jgi:hypothetical protein
MLDSVSNPDYTAFVPLHLTVPTFDPPSAQFIWAPAQKAAAVAVVSIDIGKNSFHIVGLDSRGAIVLRQKWSRGQVEARFANMPPCLIGMEACVGADHLSRKLKALGHDDRAR